MKQSFNTFRLAGWNLLVVLMVGGLFLATTFSGSAAQSGAWSEPVLLGPGWFPDITADASGRVHIAWSSAIAERDPNVPSLSGATRRGYDLVLYRYTDDGVDLSETFDIVAFRQNEGSEVTRPALLVDDQGIMHMSYRYNSVFYSQASVYELTSAKGWRKPYPISVEQVAYFSRLAQDSTGRLHLVFTENVRTYDCPICYHLFYRYSDDSGRTWSIRSDISSLPTGVAKPQLIVDSQDNLHAVWEAGAGGALGQLTDPTTVMYAASYNRGETWSRPIEFVVPDGRAKNISIGVDGMDNLVVVWLALPENRIYYQVSSDSGRTWSEAESFSGVRGGFAVFNARLDHYSMTTDTAGHIHLVVVGKVDDERGTLSLVHLTWNGLVWSEPDVITTLSGDVPEWPRITVNKGNELHVVWFVRDEEHIFDSDRGEYTVWYANRTITSPAAAPVIYPTPVPPIVPVPTPTVSPPTPTPVDPALAELPYTPEISRWIYTEIDDMLVMAQALIPAALVILSVVAFIRFRRR